MRSFGLNLLNDVAKQTKEIISEDDEIWYKSSTDQKVKLAPNPASIYIKLVYE